MRTEETHYGETTEAIMRIFWDEIKLQTPEYNKAYSHVLKTLKAKDQTAALKKEVEELKEFNEALQKNQLHDLREKLKKNHKLESEIARLRDLLSENERQNDVFRKKLNSIQNYCEGKDGIASDIWNSIENLWHEH